MRNAAPLRRPASPAAPALPWKSAISSYSLRIDCVKLLRKLLLMIEHPLGVDLRHLGKITAALGFFHARRRNESADSSDDFRFEPELHDSFGWIVSVSQRRLLLADDGGGNLLRKRHLA